MSQKTIQLNPEYLSIKGKKKDKHNTTRKVRPTAPVNPSKLRKDFLKRIKEHQVKTEKSENTNNENTLGDGDVKKDGTFNREFNSSMEYLEKISKERVDKKKQQRSMKRIKKQKHIIPSSEQKPEIFVNTELPKEMDMNTIQPLPVHVGEMPVFNISTQSNLDTNQSMRHNHTVKNNEPLYSSLKNGSRPTFREMMTRTIGPPAPSVAPSVAPIVAPIVAPSVAPSVAPIVAPSVAPNVINEPCKKKTVLHGNHQGSKRPIRERLIKTYKYSLGKKKKNVGVLIKNNETRRNVKKAHTDLKKSSILEIKKYLKQHNLLKSGSDAPSDVLRQLYEQTRLAGEIQNNNSDNLLHNYLTK